MADDQWRNPAQAWLPPGCERTAPERWYWAPEPMPPIAARKKRARAWIVCSLLGLLAAYLLAIFVGLPLLLTGKFS